MHNKINIKRQSTQLTMTQRVHSLMVMIRFDFFVFRILHNF